MQSRVIGPQSPPLVALVNNKVQLIWFQQPVTLNPTYKNYFKDRTILKETYTVKEAFTDGGMTLTFADGSKSAFVPAQFHVHAPSEHTFDGVYRDLEIHFVHTYVGGALGAVIGVTFDRVAGGNNENLFLDQFLPVYAQNEETVL
jgi:carbonic anhydrase